MFTCIDVATAFNLIYKNRQGNELLYLCPNHDDHHPSLKINEKKDVWMCGPCGESGNSWHLLAFVAHLNPSDKSAVVVKAKELNLINNRDIVFSDKVDEQYDYTDAEGQILFQVVRSKTHSSSCPKDCEKKNTSDNVNQVPMDNGSIT